MKKETIDWCVQHECPTQMKVDLYNCLELQTKANFRNEIADNKKIEAPDISWISIFKFWD